MKIKASRGRLRDGAGREGRGDSGAVEAVRNYKASLLFPRTCINRRLYQYNRIGDVTSQGERIKVELVEKVNGEAAFILYYLDRQLRLLSLEVSDRLRAVHRELEAAGQLDHPLSEREINELRNLRYLKRPAW